MPGREREARQSDIGSCPLPGRDRRRLSTPMSRTPSQWLAMTRSTTPDDCLHVMHIAVRSRKPCSRQRRCPRRRCRCCAERPGSDRPGRCSANLAPDRRRRSSVPRIGSFADGHRQLRHSCSCEPHPRRQGGHTGQVPGRATAPPPLSRPAVDRRRGPHQGFDPCCAHRRVSAGISDRATDALTR